MSITRDQRIYRARVTRQGPLEIRRLHRECPDCGHVTLYCAERRFCGLDPNGPPGSKMHDRDRTGDLLNAIQRGTPKIPCFCGPSRPSVQGLSGRIPAAGRHSAGTGAPSPLARPRAPRSVSWVYIRRVGGALHPTPNSRPRNPAYIQGWNLACGVYIQKA